MTEIVLASNNKKKIIELQGIFSASMGNVKILSLSDIGFTEEIEENGYSFEDNALIKASVPAALGYIGIADDSGLCVDVLGGAPGIYSARYAGEGATDAECRAKLLRELDGKPHDKRSAKFVCVMAVVLPHDCVCNMPTKYQISEIQGKRSGITPGFAATFRGECHGFITKEEHGDGGFGYDKLFYFPRYNKTFAELGAEEKNAVSHRGIAVSALADAMPVIIG